MSTGYACPVCETPQQDAEHLANHMAITGMLRDEEHADWLDDHVEGWREGSPADLAAELVDLAEQVDYDEAAIEHADLPEGARETAEGEGGRDHEHDHGHSHDHDHGHTEGGRQRTPDGVDAADEAIDGEVVDDEVEAIIEEARELTRQQFEDAAVEDADDTDKDADEHEDADEDTAADEDAAADEE